MSLFAFYFFIFQWAVTSSGSPPLVNKYVCVCVLWINWKLGKPRHWWYNSWTWYCIELSSVDISASFSFLISIRPTCTFRIWYWCHYSAPKTYQHRPRCSAVAERPHHASCLSVIIFNSTIPWALSFIISYFGFRLPMRTIKFWSVVFGVTSKLSVINKIRWCVARWRLLIVGDGRHIRSITYTPPSKCWRSSSDRCQSQILVKNRDFCLS